MFKQLGKCKPPSSPAILLDTQSLSAEKVPGC